MSFSKAKEKWSMPINEVTIGATEEQGGTRKKILKVGGAGGLPYIHFEGPTPNNTVVAMEILDRVPEDWPPQLLEALGNAVNSPAEWAEACVNKFGADCIMIRLANTHPDDGNSTPEEAAAIVKSVLEAVTVPLIVLGSDNDEKDNIVLPAASQAAKGERCLFGTVKENNYKTLCASCLADGHNLIGESPIDINIAKQVNILCSDMGFPIDRLVMYQTTGGLGYGIEYNYSIMERGRTAALSGDKMMSLPVICLIGQEAWRAKEAKASAKEFPAWGDENKRGIYWELATASVLLQAGADIMVMRHPEAVKGLHTTINELMKTN